MSRPSDQQRSSPLPQRAATEAEFGASNVGMDASADILTEDVDQAILHFSAAVKERNQPIIIRTVLFMNRVLCSTAWRTKRYREEEESAYAMQTGMGGRGHVPATAELGGGRSVSGVPSLPQWMDALESLTAAALPTALKYLRDLYQTSSTWKQSDRRCSLAVLNLVFFILVLCRQVQRRVVVLRLRQQRQVQLQQQQQHERGSAVVSPSSTIAPYLFEASRTIQSAAPPLLAAESRSLGVLETRVASLYGAQRTLIVRYLCFIAWNAEVQLHAIKVSAAVRIKGVPLLSQLPQVPLYLSEHDGWIWVWIMATLYSTLNLQRPQEPHTPHHLHPSTRVSASATMAATPSAPGQASVGTTSAGSPPPAATLRSPVLNNNINAPLLDIGPAPSAGHPSPLRRQDSFLFPAATMAAGSPRSSHHHGLSGGGGNKSHYSAARTVEDTLTEKNGEGGAGAGAGAATGASHPARSAAVQLLLQMSTHDGGELYMHKMLSVMLSSFELLLQQWTRGQPVIGELFREWTQRIVHSRLSPHVASLTRLNALFDLIVNGSLEELTRVVVTLDDVVVHTPFLFYSSARPLLQLHQLLEQLAPLQVTLLFMYQLHPEAHRSTADDDDDGESAGEYCRLPEDVDEAQSSGVRSRWTERRRPRTHEACAEALLRYCTAVSQLLAHVAELLLEPHTQRTNGFSAFQLPQSLCPAMLKNTMMFMASEIMLHEEFWASLRGGTSSAGGAGAASGGSGGGGGREGGRGGVSTVRKQWRWWAVWTNTAHFVCITGGRFGELEESDADLLYRQRQRDIFYVQAISLALEDVYTLLQMIASTETPPSSCVAARVLGSIFVRLRMFFVRLHEEHLAAISLHVVSPFSALSEDTFNAFAELLEHYVAVTAAGRSSVHRSSASLSGGSTLRSVLFSNALLNTAGVGGSSAATPPHRSLWLLAVAYLRLATNDTAAAPDGEPAKNARAAASVRRPLFSTHNFVCATPFVSLFYLRDRSYESSEDWMQLPDKWQKNILLHSRTEVPQLRDAAHLFRCYRGEVQQTEEAARELLLLASVRLLSEAVRAASRAQAAEEAERLNRSTSSFSNLHASPRGAESHASVYVTAFSRYLCMLKDISSPCLLFLLHSIRNELRCCKEREGSTRQSNASAPGGEGGNWLSVQDLLDARAFEWEVALYSV